MRTAVRLVGAAAVATGMLAMASPAYASAPPSVEDIFNQVAKNEGGSGGNGGDGNIGVNLCGLIPIAILGENKVACSAGNGGDGGDGGDATSEQVEENGGGKDKDKGKHKGKYHQSYENNKGKDGQNGKNG